MEEFECKGTTHAIYFTSSMPIFLHGIVVYGCLEGTAMYQIRLELLEEKPPDVELVGKDTKLKALGCELAKNEKGTETHIDNTFKELLASPKGKRDLSKENRGSTQVIEQARDTAFKQLNVSYMTLATERTRHVYDVMVSKPVEIVAGRRYSVRLEMDGPPTKLGVHGKSEVATENIVFHFSSQKGNKTSAEKGQIPGLLFTLPKSKPNIVQ